MAIHLLGLQNPCRTRLIEQGPEHGHEEVNDKESGECAKASALKSSLKKQYPCWNVDECVWSHPKEDGDAHQYARYANAHAGPKFG